nr:hypothetical protein [Desulfobulbaceae bacterium]
MATEQDKNEKINSELDDILKALSWANLKTIIQDVDLGKFIPVGGIRLNEKNKRFFVPALKKKCLVDEEVLSYVFATWFNAQKRYYDCLKPFFQSSEHAELLTERGVDSSKYVVNDEYFEKFIGVIKIADVDKFLIVSPMCFTSPQKDRLEQLKNKQ